MSARRGDLLARDAKALWHPYTQHALEGEPLAIRSASGAWLELEDGRLVLDGISSWWACLHGHGRPEIAEAIAAQARKLDHVLFAGATHEPAVRLAEELLALAPEGLTRVFYSDDGSTAVEAALKIVAKAWRNRGEEGRTTFVALEGAYHGDTFGAMAASDPDPFFDAYDGYLFRVERVPPDEGRLAETLERLGTRAAGVIVEPLVQGAAGMRTYPPAFLVAARELTAARGLPLIADEVFTGFGRTGRAFACELAGVAPDLMCVGKGLTGGTLPLAATLATEALFEAFLSPDRMRFFPHGHTFTANPIACAAALASLELFRATDVPARLEHVGARVAAELEHLAGDPRVAEIRRLGGIVAVELAGEGGYGFAEALDMRREALEHGVLLRPLGNVLYAVPPACCTDEECASIGRAMLALVRSPRRASARS